MIVLTKPKRDNTGAILLLVIILGLTGIAGVCAHLDRKNHIRFEAVVAQEAAAAQQQAAAAAAAQQQAAAAQQAILAGQQAVAEREAKAVRDQAEEDRARHLDNLADMNRQMDKSARFRQKQAEADYLQRTGAPDFMVKEKRQEAESISREGSTWLPSPNEIRH